MNVWSPDAGTLPYLHGAGPRSLFIRKLLQLIGTKATSAESFELLEAIMRRTGIFPGGQDGLLGGPRVLPVSPPSLP